MAFDRGAWRCLLFDFVARRVSGEIILRVCWGRVQFISMTPAVEMMLHSLQRSTVDLKSIRLFERKWHQLLGKLHARAICRVQERGQFVTAAPPRKTMAVNLLKRLFGWSLHRETESGREDNANEQRCVCVRGFACLCTHVWKLVGIEWVQTGNVVGGDTSQRNGIIAPHHLVRSVPHGIYYSPSDPSFLSGFLLSSSLLPSLACWQSIRRNLLGQGACCWHEDDVPFGEEISVLWRV